MCYSNNLSRKINQIIKIKIYKRNTKNRRRNKNE